MKQPLLTSFFSLLLFFQINAQEKSYTIPNTVFLKTIRNTRFDGCEFVGFSGSLLKLIDFRTSNIRNYVQVLLVRGGELYVFISATGIIYKCSGNIGSDSLNFERIDQTEHYGYNINCKAFVYNDRFYNIGGYGFWRWNGQLRFFDENAGDWKIERINREIPVVLEPPGFLMWKASQGKQLISLGYISAHQAEKVSENERVKSIDSVISLDLEKTDWTVLGKLNPKLNALSKTENIIIGVLDSGLVVNIQEHFQYLNLLDNKIYSLSDQSTWNFFATDRVNKISWYKDNYYYYTLIGKWQVDSVKILPQYFKFTGERVYESSNNNTGVIISGSLMAIIALGGLLYVKKRKGSFFKNEFKFSNFGSTQMRSPYPEKEVFEEIEKALLKLLIDNITLKNMRTATDEVNRVLGVASKSSDMQKRKRSDVIRAINSKYRILGPVKYVQLIERIKNEEDGRLFEYFIVDSEIENIKSYMD